MIKRGGQKLEENFSNSIKIAIITLTSSPLKLIFYFWVYIDLISVYLLRFPLSYKLFVYYLKLKNLTPLDEFPKTVHIYYMLINGYCNWYYGLVNIFIVLIPFIFKPSNKNFIFLLLVYLFSITKVFKWVDFMVYGHFLILFVLLRSPKFKFLVLLIMNLAIYIRTGFTLDHNLIPVCDLCMVGWVRRFGIGSVVPPYYCPFDKSACSSRIQIHFINGVVHYNGFCDCYYQGIKCKHLNETSKTEEEVKTLYVESRDIGFNVSHTKLPEWLFNSITSKVYFLYKGNWELMEDVGHIRRIITHQNTDSPSILGLGKLIPKQHCPGKSYFSLTQNFNIFPHSICPKFIN